jgi:hypothetical protein
MLNQMKMMAVFWATWGLVRREVRAEAVLPNNERLGIDVNFDCSVEGRDTQERT